MTWDFWTLCPGDTVIVYRPNGTSAAVDIEACYVCQDSPTYPGYRFYPFCSAPCEAECCRVGAW